MLNMNLKFKFSLLFIVLIIINLSNSSKLTCNKREKSETYTKFTVDFNLYLPNKDNTEDDEGDDGVDWDLLDATAEYFEPTDDGYRQIKIKNLKKTLRKYKFDYKSKTYIIVHGFLDSKDADWVIDMIKELAQYHKGTKINIIVVDWSAAFYAQLKELDIEGLTYRKAALKTEYTALKITEFISKIADSYPDFKNHHDLHFIGHSLGAHIVGQAARKLRQEKKISVQRVTGLDPANPCFETDAASLKIRQTDAEFVDIIHSNCVHGKNHNLGNCLKSGHSDFYPNGGTNQTECFNKPAKWHENPVEYLWDQYSYAVNSAAIDLFLMSFVKWQSEGDLKKKFLENLLLKEDYDIICEHGEAPYYFINSLKASAKMYSTAVKYDLKRGFTVDDKLKCENKRCEKNPSRCNQMGIHAKKHTKNDEVFYIDMDKKPVALCR